MDEFLFNLDVSEDVAFLDGVLEDGKVGHIFRGDGIDVFLFFVS